MNVAQMIKEVVEKSQGPVSFNQAMYDCLMAEIGGLMAMRMTELCRTGMIGDVLDFQTKFGQPRPPLPTPMPKEEADFRMGMFDEETREFKEAVQSGDLEKIAQEGVDVIYTTLGTLISSGINPYFAWTEVHLANMEKVRSTEGKKVVKPEGWNPPNMKGVMQAQMHRLTLAAQSQGKTLEQIVSEIEESIRQEDKENEACHV